MVGWKHYFFDQSVDQLHVPSVETRQSEADEMVHGSWHQGQAADCEGSYKLGFSTPIQNVQRY